MVVTDKWTLVQGTTTNVQSCTSVCGSQIAVPYVIRWLYGFMGTLDHDGFFSTFQAAKWRKLPPFRVCAYTEVYVHLVDSAIHGPEIVILLSQSLCTCTWTPYKLFSVVAAVRTSSAVRAGLYQNVPFNGCSWRTNPCV